MEYETRQKSIVSLEDPVMNLYKMLKNEAYA